MLSQRTLHGTLPRTKYLILIKLTLSYRKIVGTRLYKCVWVCVLAIESVYLPSDRVHFHFPLATHSLSLSFSLSHLRGAVLNWLPLNWKKGKPSNLFSICYFIFFHSCIFFLYATKLFLSSLLRLGFLHNSDFSTPAWMKGYGYDEAARCTGLLLIRETENEWRKKAIL